METIKATDKNDIKVNCIDIKNTGEIKQFSFENTTIGQVKIDISHYLMTENLSHVRDGWILEFFIDENGGNVICTIDDINYFLIEMGHFC